MNVPGESTLRREFLRLQQENKSNSEALKQQQQQLAAQHRDSEAHIKHLLHQRQRRIEEQKEERRRVEEVNCAAPSCVALMPFLMPFLDWVPPSQHASAREELALVCPEAGAVPLAVGTLALRP